MPGDFIPAGPYVPEGGGGGGDGLTDAQVKALIGIRKGQRTVTGNFTLSVADGLLDVNSSSVTEGTLPAMSAALDGRVFVLRNAGSADVNLVATDGDVWGYQGAPLSPPGYTIQAGATIILTANATGDRTGWSVPYDSALLVQTEGGGGATRTIRPYIAFNSAPITDAFWAMAPAGTLIWILESNDAPSGFYRADGTDTLVRATEYDSNYLDTDVYLEGQLVSTLAGFASNDPDALIGQNLHWHLRDWDATDSVHASVGVLDTSVFVNYEPTNYTTESEDGVTNLGNHLVGINNKFGETGDHRALTHRNDANQHTGDAVKVTTTWPGDSEPSDKTLTEGIAAVIAAATGPSILEVQVFT